MVLKRGQCFVNMTECISTPNSSHKDILEPPSSVSKGWYKTKKNEKQNAIKFLSSFQTRMTDVSFVCSCLFPHSTAAST